MIFLTNGKKLVFFEKVIRKVLKIINELFKAKRKIKLSKKIHTE